MAVTRVANGASDERTLKKHLFESEDEYLNADPAIVESVSESSTGRETEKMVPSTTS